MTTATPIRMKNWRSWLRSVKLASGGHDSPESGMCLMEAIAYMQGQPFSDHPQCVSPVIGAFGRSWNDSLDDAGRQRLKQFIPIMVGTATTPADDEARAWLATDWLVRTFTPTWLDKAGLTEHAANLRALPELTSTALARAAQPIIEDARKASYAAWAAAWAAARDAARDAAWAAARAAAGDAAWAAAWDAARAAAWDAAGAAARAAAGDAAGDAAWDAARDAAWAAAWDAARDAAGVAAWYAARDAAGDAAGEKKGYRAQYNVAYEAARPLVDLSFADTVTELTASADDLLQRMCAVGRVVVQR